jgi:hypothetical protein
MCYFDVIFGVITKSVSWRDIAPGEVLPQAYMPTNVQINMHRMQFSLAAFEMAALLMMNTVLPLLLLLQAACAAHLRVPRGHEQRGAKGAEMAAAAAAL